MRRNDKVYCNKPRTTAEHSEDISSGAFNQRQPTKTFGYSTSHGSQNIYDGCVGWHLHTGDEDANPSGAYARFAGRHPDGGQNKVQLYTGDIVVPTDPGEKPSIHSDIPKVGMT